jgi:hypothetical protein
MANRWRIFHATFALALAIGALAAVSAAADVTLGQVAQGMFSPGNCPITGDGFVLASSDTLNPYTWPPAAARSRSGAQAGGRAATR